MEHLKNLLPSALRSWLSDRRVQARRAMLVTDRLRDFGDLRRVTPYREDFGWTRGQCIDRYYIEQFLGENADAIRGRVLEVGSANYTKIFGKDRVAESSVVDIDAENPNATVIDDLTQGDVLSDESFNCIVATQVLLFIYDFDAALRVMYRKMKPGAVLLATMPGIAQLCPPKMIGKGEDYWRFTRFSAHRVFEDVFGPDNVAVQSYGNVLAATGLLHGLVSDELSTEELDSHDPNYEVTIAVKAIKR